MPTSSDLAIVNEGLVRLGVPPIGSFSDQSAQSLAIAAIYENVRDELIADHPWVFAVQEKPLASIEVDEIDLRYQDYGRVYQMPSDCLRALGLTCCGGYQISGNQLYTDSPEAVLLYIYRAPVSLWPPYFRELVAKEVSAAFAMSLTDSSSRTELFYSIARQSRQRARSIDGQQVPNKVLRIMRAYARRSYNPLRSA